ncbi:MAG: histidinol-phosphate transaminase [bacterium]|nr:histidinol-phosphate transaminase [bacterium]
MKDTYKYLRTNIKGLSAYVPGEQPRDSSFIKLNTNENPYPPSKRVISKIKQAVNRDLRLYPDPIFKNLRKRISNIYKIDYNQIIIGNGSDELLDMIMKAFVGKKDKVVCTYPTYNLYKVLSSVYEANLVEIESNEDFQIPIDKLIDANGHVTFLCNPNTPTGIFTDISAIRKLCDNVKGVVVVDEAYVDFARGNCLELIKGYENLIVLRTLSKSFSLAGARIGIGFGSLIPFLYKVKDSYNVNRISLVAAEAALDDILYAEANIKRIINLRSYLTNCLKKLEFQVYPSEANFILIKTRHAYNLYKYLKDKKILVRYFNQRRLKDKLRITIGKKGEMDLLINAIKDYLKGVCDGKD